MSNHTIDILERFVDSFVSLYVLLVFAWIVMSFLRLPFNLWVYRIRRFLDDTVEPYVRVFRRFVPSMGMLDLSPMIAVIALFAVDRVAISVLESFRPGP
jgi:YggT family protein